MNPTPEDGDRSAEVLLNWLPLGLTYSFLYFARYNIKSFQGVGLTEAEYDIIKQHPIVGERLCGNLRSLAPVRPIVRHHHARLDGQGYPDRLTGDDVPLLAQIVGVVDVYDALTTARPYRAALSHNDAFGELRREASEGLFRESLVEAFIDVRSTQFRPVA